jgi:Holliday junction DNA helicase RuvA
MIVRISGKIVERGTHHVVVDMGGVCYQVFIPQAVIERLDEHVSGENRVNLITYHYYQVEPSRSIPVLIGFLNEIEKEFFEAFITVSGIGPRAAVKALNKPISSIAKAIDEANIDFLKSLPGIGQQRAKEIVAKLQNKVARFGLIQDNDTKQKYSISGDIQDEAMAVLTQLEYKKSEAMAMIKKAMERCSDIHTTEELLNEVYKQRQLK